MGRVELSSASHSEHWEKWGRAGTIGRAEGLTFPALVRVAGPLLWVLLEELKEGCFFPLPLT